MATNGGWEPAVITLEEWEQIQRRVAGLEELSVNLGALMGEMGRTRKAAEAAKDIATTCANKLTTLEVDVRELTDWKEDSKVQHINTLQGRVRSLEKEKKAAEQEAERDRLDLRRSIRAALISSMVAALVGWGFAKLTTQPHAPALAPAGVHP